MRIAMRHHNEKNPLKLFRPCAIAAVLLAITPTIGAMEIDSDIENVLKFGQEDAKYGQIKFNLRYRYEYADTKGTPPQPAHANTFRLRLG
jgi:hypothetical protein